MRYLDGADENEKYKLWTDAVDCGQKELQASNRSNFTCNPSV